MSVLFAYPRQAAFGRVVPKSKIYDHAKPSRGLRERFVAEVEQIVWQYKLSPETVNLPARAGISEIQVFAVELRTDEPSETVLRCIDKAIPFPVLYELKYGDSVRSMVAYKRPSDAGAGPWVVDAYFGTTWKPADSPRVPLPVALDLASLYEGLLRAHCDLPARDGECLRDQVARIAAIRAIEKECRRVEQRMQREVQFNRKVELNRELRRLKSELRQLTLEN